MVASVGGNRPLGGLRILKVSDIGGGLASTLVGLVLIVNGLKLSIVRLIGLDDGIEARMRLSLYLSIYVYPGVEEALNPILDGAK